MENPTSGVLSPELATAYAGDDSRSFDGVGGARTDP